MQEVVLRYCNDSIEYLHAQAAQRGCRVTLHQALSSSDLCVLSLNIQGLPFCLLETRNAYSCGLFICLRDFVSSLLHGDSTLFLSCFSGGCFPDPDIKPSKLKSVLLFMHGKRNTSGFLGSYQGISKLYQVYRLGGTNKSVRPDKTACLKP